MIENHPQESLLIRYSDGATTPDEDQQVQELVARDPAAAGFLQQMEQTRSWLKQASEIPLDPTPTPAIVSDYQADSPGQKPAQRSRLALVATLFAGLIGGALLGTGFKSETAETIASARFESSPPEWVRLVADYHRLYARETIDNSPTQLASDVSAELSATLNRQLTVPELQDIGLEFKRVQALVYDDQSLLQLAYLPEVDRPIAICILTGNVAGESVVSGMHGKMQYAYWQSEGHAVVVVGELSQQQMDQVVTEVRRSLFSVS